MDRIRFILTAIALAVLMVSCEIVRDEARIIDVEPSELYSFPYQRYVLKNTGGCFSLDDGCLDRNEMVYCR